MPAQSNGEMIEELYNRLRQTDVAVGVLGTKVDEMGRSFSAQVTLMREQNDKFLKLIYRLLSVFGALLLIMLGALIYGAIGKEGLHSVRQAMPINVSDGTIHLVPCDGDDNRNKT